MGEHDDARCTDQQVGNADARRSHLHVFIGLTEGDQHFVDVDHPAEPGGWYAGRLDETLSSDPLIGVDPELVVRTSVAGRARRAAPATSATASIDEAWPPRRQSRLPHEPESSSEPSSHGSTTCTCSEYVPRVGRSARPTQIEPMGRIDSEVCGRPTAAQHRFSRSGVKDSVHQQRVIDMDSHDLADDEPGT